MTRYESLYETSIFCEYNLSLDSKYNGIE